MTKTRPRPAGVTLLEIVVAVAVLGVGLATIFQIFPMGFAASAQAKSRATAYQLAAEKLEQIRKNYIFGGVPDTANVTNLWSYWGIPTVKTTGIVRVAPDPQTPNAALPPVNTQGFFIAFSDSQLPERNYYYRVDVVPVIDPGTRYKEYIYQDTATGNVDGYSGFATMYRVIVTVRGPLRQEDEAQDAQWDNNPLARSQAVQIKLATYIANKRMGSGTLQASYYASRSDPIPADAFAATALAPNEETLYLDTTTPAWDFTVFNLEGGLLATEESDTGPLQGSGDGGNDLRFDNVSIWSGETLSETNKLVDIRPPTSATAPWTFKLLNPLKGRVTAINNPADPDDDDVDAYVPAQVTVRVHVAPPAGSGP